MKSNKGFTVVYDNIQLLCKEKGISVSQAEAAAGIPDGSTSNWRHERRWMIHLPAIARELDVTIDELFHVKYENFKTQESATPLMRIFSALESQEIDDETATLIISVSQALINCKKQNGT